MILDYGLNQSLLGSWPLLRGSGPLSGISIHSVPFKSKQALLLLG